MRICLCLLLSLLVPAADLDAQSNERIPTFPIDLQRSPSASRPDTTSETYSPYARSIVDHKRLARSTEDLLLAGALGWAAGLAAGAAVGYAIQPNAGESYIGAGEWWMGALLGSSFGAATGAHLANGREGKLLLSSGGALLSVPVALLVSVPLVMIDGAGIFIVPIAQIGTSVFLERRTSRRQE
jgi:hypothetical protein